MKVDVSNKIEKINKIDQVLLTMGFGLGAFEGGCTRLRLGANDGRFPLLSGGQEQDGFCVGLEVGNLDGT